MNNLQEIVALWDKYHYSIATDAMEYDRKLRQLLFANSNVCDVSDANIEELISKRQAIDASIEAINSWNKSCSIGQQKRIENYIKQLPSAQPDTYWKEQCQSYERTINKLRESLSKQPEIIRCCECKYLQCNMRPDGYLPKGVDEFECRHWCGSCDTMDFCSLAERREVTT